MDNQNSQIDPGLLTGLAMIGGLGMTIMIVAAGVGVADSTVDSQVIGLFVLIGFIILISAILTWLFVAQPYRSFDNIDIPAPDEHAHEHDHAHQEETAAHGAH